MAGKEELCALAKDAEMDEETVNRIRNPSRLVFESLRQIRMTQPDIREINLSAKRKLASSERSAGAIHDIHVPKRPRRQKSAGARPIPQC